jgi:FkbM family methyltransferase
MGLRKAGGSTVKLRSALEHVTHPFAIRRRLPRPFDAARIYASSEGGLRYLGPRMKRVDPALLRLAGELIRQGDVVWDIGANLGLFTFAASVASGQGGYVLAVEPDIQLVALLHRASAVNRGHASVEVVPAAVADSLGVSRFHIAARNRSTNHLDGFGTSQAGGIRATHLVPTMTMDWLATQFPSPDVVKIDVEEAEGTVLAGAGDLLRTHPRIICEVAARNSATVATILKDHGYTLYDGNQPAQKREALSLAPHNTLALPAQGLLR